ncbi:MAG TPA: tetratricopeptide repeat protein [Mycobacteriales bacterium]|nr:tetratricopeptide repeat protein [Mycobacteriales bacterium]
MPPRRSVPSPREPDPALAEVATRVRAVRARLGLSQEQLAKQLQVSFATVNRWEGGRHRMSAAGRARFEQLEAARPAPAEQPVTSRTARAAGWPLAVLPCPPPGADAGAVVASEAGLRFVRRAHEVEPDFVVTDQSAPAVAEICHAVDGAALAIDTLAAWVGTLSVHQIAEHGLALLYPGGTAAGVTGSSMPALDAAIRTGYDALEPAVQELVGALAVFEHSFALSDAAPVVDRDLATTAAYVRRLAAGSWLVVEPGPTEHAYRMPAVLRQFGRHLSAGSDGAGDVRSRHAQHFAELAAASEDGLLSVDRADWVTRMNKASADIDAALTWALDAGERDLGLAMSADLWLWWLTTGRLADGRRWLREFLKWSRDASPSAVAGAWCAVAVLEVESGDYPDAIDHATRALETFQTLDDLDGCARAATALGSAERYLGHRGPARRYFEQAMNFRRSLGDDRGLASALNNMALLALDDGDLVEAARRFEESLLVKRRLSEPRTVAIGLANLSDVLIRLGYVGQALDALYEAAGIAADLGDLQLLATIECNLGDAAATGGDQLGAVGHFETSLDAYRASGGAHDLVPALCGLARALHALGRSHEAVARLREAEALSTATERPEQLARIRATLSDIGHPTTLPLPGGLTARQAQILRSLATGASNKQIADSLSISVATVERHLATIYQKLGLRGRVEAARYALKHGLAVAADSEPGDSSRSDYMVPRIPTPFRDA